MGKNRVASLWVFFWLLETRAFGPEDLSRPCNWEYEPQAWFSLPVKLGKSNAVISGEPADVLGIAGEDLRLSSAQTHLWVPVLGKKNVLYTIPLLFPLC